MVPLVGARIGDERMMAVGGPTALAGFALTLLSFAALTYAYVVSDFSVVNVWENSHSQKPMLYKVTGVWGNHEGSMLPCGSSSWWGLERSSPGSGVICQPLCVPTCWRSRD